MDQNAHCDRQVATTAKEEQRYYWKYRKQSKNWDVIPVKTKKEYKGTTVAWFLKIGISQNTKCDNLVCFPKSGHKYNLFKMPTPPAPYCKQKILRKTEANRVYGKTNKIRGAKEYWIRPIGLFQLGIKVDNATELLMKSPVNITW